MRGHLKRNINIKRSVYTLAFNVLLRFDLLKSRYSPPHLTPTTRTTTTATTMTTTTRQRLTLTNFSNGEKFYGLRGLRRDSLQSV